jgi:hypothetical protein
MEILEYNELDTSPAKARYAKVVEMLRRDDFRSAEVKKLPESDFYRAKLDDTNRLLFQIRHHDGKRYALLLEVIAHHAYDKSRFLRGASIDEARIDTLLSVADCPLAGLAPLPYVNPARPQFNLLDKPISFDEMQAAIYHQPLPLILVGSAGSGKTAVLLEKAKHLAGDVLYVTHSPFLAQSARNLYYANGYDPGHQQIEFLCFREFLETIRVPPGREVNFPAFRSWYERFPKPLRPGDAHRLFEEFKGVLTGTSLDGPCLSRAQYLELGVRQSIFQEEERQRIYDLFEKYRAWLAQAGLFDANLVAQGYLAECPPRYDAVVVDEVQDITPVQLALILRALKKPEHFLLCGDSNQIVHPNFFSWARVKTLFFHSQQPATQAIRILHANYRNSPEITEVANRLLKVKHQRFGSIDKESNYLVESVSALPGQVLLLPDKDAVKRDLDQKTRQSVRFAVLVLRDEHKEEARQFFKTPLIFSIHEAKGLEYENVIAYRFISGERASFLECAAGVRPADLEDDLLDYARARDKSDKSLECYKFFVNALYVAITRAVRCLYLIEGDTGHPLLGLLNLSESGGLTIANTQSSLEDWQREARRLELQGKEEQAEAIRKNILHTRAVPWEAMTAATVQQLARKALDPANVSQKQRERLFEYACFCRDTTLLERIVIGGACRSEQISPCAERLQKRYLPPYAAKKFKDVLREVDYYGVDFRNPFHHTPLMMATAAGNLPLIDALLERGANIELTDNQGRAAFHLALRRALHNPAFARGGDFAALWSRLVIPSVSVQVGGRLVKIDAHQGEFFLFHTLIARFHDWLGGSNGRGLRGFAVGDFVPALGAFPEAVLRDYRKKREYWNAMFAKNEMHREQPYNRRLFLRTVQGQYLFNPLLEIRRPEASGEAKGEEWVPIHQALGLPADPQDVVARSRWLVEQLARLRESARKDSPAVAAPHTGAATPSAAANAAPSASASPAASTDPTASIDAHANPSISGSPDPSTSPAVAPSPAAAPSASPTAAASTSAAPDTGSAASPAPIASAAATQTPALTLVPPSSPPTKRRGRPPKPR